MQCHIAAFNYYFCSTLIKRLVKYYDNWRLSELKKYPNCRSRQTKEFSANHSIIDELFYIIHEVKLSHTHISTKMHIQFYANVKNILL